MEIIVGARKGGDDVVTNTCVTLVQGRLDEPLSQETSHIYIIVYCFFFR